MARVDKELQEVLEADRGILEAFGMHSVSVEDGVCELKCRVPAGLINAGGFAHGSISYSLMDTACAYALRSVGVAGVTTHGNVSYVKGAQADSELTARVEVVSRARRVATLRGEVFLIENGVPELAAHGSFVFQLRVID